MISRPHATWLAAASVALLLVTAAIGLRSPAPFEYAEGDTATWIARVRRGQPIYRATGELPILDSNYPPGYLALVARLAPSEAALLPVARAVSLAALLAAALLLGALAAEATGARADGLLAALLFAGTLRAGFWGLVCRGDMLALALELAGLWAVVRRARLWPVLCGAAFAAALCTKQTLIAIPVGVALSALAIDRARGLLLVATTAALTVGGLAATGALGAVIGDSRAGFHALALLRHLVTSVAPSALALGLAAGLWRRRAALDARARRVAGPLFASLLASVAWLPALGRVGAEFNYVIELVAISSVLAVMAGGRRLVTAHAAVCLAETAGFCAWLIAFAIPAGAAQLEVARRALAGVDGEILAEQTWHATATGHTPLTIPFLTAQRAAGGRWDPSPLVARLRAGQVARVLLLFDLGDPVERGHYWHEERFPRAVLDAVHLRYGLVARGSGLYVYAPRDLRITSPRLLP